ncbi:MAG: hypothetical protein AB9903_22320 [Vulcanimicrobiota bacterium]
MGPDKSPWIEVPDDLQDGEYSSHSGCRAFQEYFGLKVKPDIVNEYLLGEGICPYAETEIERFTATESSGNLLCEGTMKVTGPLKQGGKGTDFIKICRTLNINDKECHFNLMSASKVRIKAFGVEYYRRVIPLLRKLGIEKIKTHPTTTAESSQERYNLLGAYVWSFYGYSNDKMAETLNQYIDWLKNTKKIKLDPATEGDIRSFKRMHKLANDAQPNGEKTGEKFLKGLDAQDKPTRTIWWCGTHHNINDESPQNIEMIELIEYLLRKIK